jgi:acyl-CoA thioesterase
MNHFGRLLEMNFKILEIGKVEYHLIIQQKHLATTQVAHGGVIAALTDAALGVAALSVVAADNKLVATIEFKINYLLPAYINDKLTAVAQVINKGKRTLVAECKIFNSDNKLISTATGTFTSYSIDKIK